MTLKLAPKFYRHNNLIEEWRYYTHDDVHHSFKLCLSSKGRVLKIFTETDEEKFINPGHINGYTSVTFKTESGKYISRYLHKMMAQTFYEKPEGSRYVIHKNFEKEDNSLGNLAWVDKKGKDDHQNKNPNVLAFRAKGLRSYTKLSYAEAKVLKKKLLDPNRRTRLRILAKQFGVSEMQLHRIKTGENWGDLSIE